MGSCQGTLFNKLRPCLWDTLQDPRFVFPGLDVICIPASGTDAWNLILI